MLTLKLFGTASMEGPGGPVTGRAAQGLRLALLAVLAVARGRPVTRDKLTALLSPESNTERARHQLSNTLYILRGALGEDVVRSTNDEIALSPDTVTSDVERFERLLDEGRLEPAVELFAGPLLDGFHLTGAAEFEHWLDTERGRLGRRYAAALESLAEAREACDQFAAAAGWWHRIAVHDPYGGRVALRLMRALEAAGDRAGALRHARVHAALLREEFDADPDPDVKAFAERLRVEPPPRSAPEPVAVRPAPASPTPDPAPGSSVGAPRARRWPARGYAAALGAAAMLLVVALVAVSGAPSVPPAAAPARSLAVLPFVDMSPDSEHAYFGDGLSEQIIAAASRIEGLSVAARTSSFALRDGRLDVRAIGDTLGVGTVLEGSVRRNGDRLRVTAQLIDATSGYHIWSKEYDRDLADVFAVQDEIAGAIAVALELRLARRAAPPPARHTPGLEAYDLYLRGLFLRNTLAADELRQASDYLDRAIELEPGFAAAYAAKASVVAPLVFFGYVRREPAVSELRALTARALEIDSTLGEAHAALGVMRLFFEWDWEGAERALRRAIELNPSDPHAWHHLANLLRATGRFRDAVAARERAVELDPLNPRTGMLLGIDYAAAGDREQAVDEFHRALRLNPGNPLALGAGPALPIGLGGIYLDQGRHEEAVEEYLKAAMLRGATAGERDTMRRAFRDSGMTGFWRSWLARDLRLSGNTPDPFRLATVWLNIGDTVQAFDWLERAHRERNPGLVFVRSSAFERVRSHPRMARILAEMRLPNP